jgi:hypothetical protein
MTIPENYFQILSSGDGKAFYLRRSSQKRGDSERHAVSRTIQLHQENSLFGGYEEEGLNALGLCGCKGDYAFPARTSVYVPEKVKFCGL